MTRPRDRALADATLLVLALQVAIGVLGSALHLHADLTRPGADMADEILYGAPPFAPLLFVDLAVLAALGIWDVREKVD